MVQSHLVWFGFIKDYMSETEDNNPPHQQQPPLGTTLLLATMQVVITSRLMICSKTWPTTAGGGGDGDGEPAAVMEPKDMEIFEALAKSLDHDNILFGSPRWPENLER
jgi:hypothetical protein